MSPKRVFKNYSVPQLDDFRNIITEVIDVLKSENEVLRPLDETECPGAFLDINSFDPTIPVVLVPDLHARLDFFNEIVNFPLPTNDSECAELTIYEALLQGKVFVICLGDGLHSEKRGFERWQQAQKEWLKGKPLNDYICTEMEEGLGLMTSVMRLKKECPNYFHFLKGNHENILNVQSCGNLPFRKFASEGEMVKDFMLSLYGRELVCMYADFENNLPLFALGSNFLVSHAEPRKAFSRLELINAYLEEETVLGLTWTHTNEAEDGSVQRMINDLLPKEKNAVYFAGHRTVSGTHRILRDGAFIQIHNPNEHFISIVRPKRDFNPLSDIYNTRTGKLAEG